MKNILGILQLIAITAIIVCCLVFSISEGNPWVLVCEGILLIMSIVSLISSIIEYLNRDVTYVQNVQIKYFDDELEKVEELAMGDLIDLRASEDIEIKCGDYALIPLGVAMKLPEGYKANVYPRSSTYKNFGIIMTNSVGQIDNSYCGDNDQWMFPALAIRDTVIHKNDRICQFEIVPIQPPILFTEVDHLEDEDRGGIGSTGVN